MKYLKKDVNKNLLKTDLPPDMRFINACECLVLAKTAIERKPLLGKITKASWLTEYEKLIKGIAQEIRSNLDMMNFIRLSHIVKYAESFSGYGLSNNAQISKVTFTSSSVSSDKDVTFYIYKYANDADLNKELSIHVSCYKPSIISYSSYSKAQTIRKERTIDLYTSINARTVSTTDEILFDELEYVINTIYNFIIHIGEETKNAYFERKDI